MGDGYIAQFHKRSILALGHEIAYVYDPKLDMSFNKERAYGSDFVVICSPTDTHREITKQAIKRGCQVICEKPLCLPWEPIIDDDRVNVVLQYRYLDLPEKADRVFVRMVRDGAYFSSWKGDPMKTGGVFYNLFIHYIDLAHILNSDFHGEIMDSGDQVRIIDTNDNRIDIKNYEYDTLYRRMYEDILGGGGIKPREVFYLQWLLQKMSEQHGWGGSLIGKTIKIPRYLM
jgi:hypothetical protein